MTSDQWKNLTYFKSTENWGNPDLMDNGLIQTLDEYRHFVQTPIIVLRGTQGQGVQNSQHALGRAVDILFPQMGLYALFDLMMAAMRFEAFKGIGIYPDWQYGGNIHGGLHLDVREDVTRRAQWMGVKINGQTQYLELTTKNLKQYKLV